MNGPTLTLQSAGGATRTVPWRDAATPALHDQARGEANAWIKRLRLVPYGDLTMRQRFHYRGDSLWWFTELYLHKMRRLEEAVLTVRALDAARARYAPTRLTLSGADWATSAAARAWGAARGVAVDTPGAPGPDTTGRRREAAAVAGEAVTARLLRRRARPRPAPVAAFVHTAFVRERDTYIGPVLDAVAAAGGPGALALVGVGPGRGQAGNGTAATLTSLAPLRALRGAWALWRQRDTLADALTGGDAIRDAARVDGVDLWEVLAEDLRGAATVQWPWSGRTMDEMGAALDALTPHTVVTYAEAGGPGRALVIEARRRGIRSIGLQHGFIYRHWLNYRHEPDELVDDHGDSGCPIPDLTLVFDRYAEAYLREAGHFPADRLAVTGSARLDALAATLASLTPADRETTRAGFGAATADHRMALLAAKFTEVRDDLPPLIDAVAADHRVRLVIKPHPADAPGVYAPLIAGVTNTLVADVHADLAHLMAAADVIVTKNSTVALDGLALGIPALVVGLPNNLTPFVDAGVMQGATAPEEIGPGLAAVLYDREVGVRLREAARVFADAYGLRPAGTAAREAAALILREGKASQ